MILSDSELKQEVEEGLIQDYIDLDTQLTPNGFDFTVNRVFRIDGEGKVDFSNSERDIPDYQEVSPQKKSGDDDYGWWQLEKGSYVFETNETVDIPSDLVGFAYPRSTLLRMGVSVQNGVWDSGYTGKSRFLVVVHNSDGVEIKENARVNHIVFHRKEESEDTYEGRYKHT